MKRHVKLFEEHTYDAMFSADWFKGTPEDLALIKSTIKNSPHFAEFVGYGFDICLHMTGSLMLLLGVNDAKAITDEAKVYQADEEGDYTLIAMNYFPDKGKWQSRCAMSDAAYWVHDGKPVGVDEEGYEGLAHSSDLFSHKVVDETAYQAKLNDLTAHYNDLMNHAKTILDKCVAMIQNDMSFELIKNTGPIGQSHVDKRLSDAIDDLW